MLSYLVESNIYLLFFYSFYKFFLQKESYFQANRAYLLGSSLGSLLLPLLNLQWTAWWGNSLSPDTLIMLRPFVVGIVPAIDQSTHWQITAFQAIAGIYFLGVAIRTAHLGLQLHYTLRLFWKYKKQYVHQANNCYVAQQSHVPTCSFGRYILLHMSVCQLSSGEQKQILLHEQTHALQYHTVDILWCQVIAVVYWFNPIVQYYRQALQNTHEYIADRAALQWSESTVQYGKLIISQMIVDVRTHLSIVHSFSNNQIKNRLQMLRTKNNHRYTGIKYAAIPFFILFCLSSISCSKEIMQTSAKLAVSTWKDVASYYNGRDEMAIGATPGDEFIMVENDIIGIDWNEDGKMGDLHLLSNAECNGFAENSDKMPAFQGGPEGLLAYLGANTLYPEKAREDNIMGMVFVGYAIDEQGNVVNVRLKKGIHPALDAEALRVVSSMPAWEPATIDGKPASVEMTLPIKFALE